jgi:tRNA-Thr(GGU) m(6)t(6)A37 methyltransferase TsaA
MILANDSGSMNEQLPRMTLKAIGIVRNGIKRDSPQGFEQILSDIVLDINFTEALDGIDSISHIVVLFWLHQVSNRPPLKLHPQSKYDLPLVGVFATRSQHRPNPIGETTVRLIERRCNILKVIGLDAMDGTPVIDIKPYLSKYDSVTDIRVPSWTTKQ